MRDANHQEGDLGSGWYLSWHRFIDRLKNAYLIGFYVLIDNRVGMIPPSHPGENVAKRMSVC